MQLSRIVELINERLAGETLMYNQLQGHMDAVIDDINTACSSCYPAFSDFTLDCFPKYPNYNMIPDKFIRSVVVVGAAYKFYITDEEGAEVATAMGYEYQNNLYSMVRDYSMHIPFAWQECGGMLPSSHAYEEFSIDYHNLY